MCASLEQHSISYDGLVDLYWHFMDVDQHAYWAGLGWWMQACSVPCDQKFSYKWNLSFFKTVPPNRVLFYLGGLLHIISSLYSHFCLLQNAILHKMLKLEFWNFNSIFLRMQFPMVAASFSLVLVICLSWYLHLKLSHECLTFICFNIWRWKSKSIRFLHLKLVTWHFGSQIVFPNF